MAVSEYVVKEDYQRGEIELVEGSVIHDYAYEDGYIEPDVIASLLSQGIIEPVAEQEVQVNAAKKAIALAEELGIDLSLVEGTGKDGKITKGDVESAATDLFEEGE